MLKLTRQAAEFASSLRFDDLPPKCMEATRVGIADCVGVMLAGANEEAVQIIASLVPEVGGAGSALEIPSGRRLQAADAALVNGAAAHVLDYDDVALSGHPSAVLVPALLAEGQALGRSGSELVTAYVAGYEIWALLEALEPGAYHERGFHPTAVFGTIAAAAACARLNKLNLDQATSAIAIGASMASGLVANFGTMTKCFHAGRAAQSGITAARMAARGFTAAADVLEHQTGFMRAHSPSSRPDLDRADAELGRTWRMPVSGINVKRYPTCYGTHRAIDAMLDLVLEKNLKPRDIAEIRVRTGVTQRLMLRNSHPITGLEAKFSMQFAMAAPLVARRVGLAELTDEFVRLPEVRAIFDQVTIAVTEEKAELDFAPDDRVSVVLKDGRTIEHPPVAKAKGSWARPLTRAELAQKFTDCAARQFDPGRSAALFEQLWRIHELKSVSELLLAK